MDMNSFERRHIRVQQWYLRKTRFVLELEPDEVAQMIGCGICYIQEVEDLLCVITSQVLTTLEAYKKTPPFSQALSSLTYDYPTMQKMVIASLKQLTRQGPPIGATARRANLSVTDVRQFLIGNYQDHIAHQLAGALGFKLDNYLLQPLEPEIMATRLSSMQASELLAQLAAIWKDSGQTSEELAWDVVITPETVRSIFSQKTDVSIKTFLSLTEALGYWFVIDDSKGTELWSSAVCSIINNVEQLSEFLKNYLRDDRAALREKGVLLKPLNKQRFKIEDPKVNNTLSSVLRYLHLLGLKWELREVPPVTEP